VFIALKCFDGYTTPPFASTTATPALVCVLHGLTVSWKQVIAYYYTGDSTPGVEL